MRTILLISRCPPYPAQLGDRLIIWHLARELHRRGYTIDLLALHDRPEDPQDIHHYRAFFRHIQLIPEPPRGSLGNLRRLLLPGARFASSPEASFCPALWRSIANQLSRHKYDLVHCFGSVTVYEFLPLFVRLPKLITPYESYSLYLRTAAQQGNLRATVMLPLVRRFERFMFTPFDRTVVISDVDAAMLRDLQPGAARGSYSQRHRSRSIPPRRDQTRPQHIDLRGQLCLCAQSGCGAIVDSPGAAGRA